MIKPLLDRAIFEGQVWPITNPYWIRMVLRAGGMFQRGWPKSSVIPAMPRHTRSNGWLEIVEVSDE